MRSAFRRLTVLFLCVCAIAASAAPAKPMTAGLPVPGDRWMEIDLYWFERTDMQHSVDEFWDRFAPLYRGIQGDRGVILNIGWTVGFIMDWSGDLNKVLDLPQGKGQQPWVSETGPLTGTTDERIAAWKERFSKPIMVEKKGYGPWTYADIKKLNEMLRATGAKRGIANFKTGALVYAWTNSYGEVPGWIKRHPEAFSTSVDPDDLVFANARKFYDPAAKLHQDDATMGGMPGGLQEGTTAHAAFAAQWGSMSKAVGLQALMLRDSFGFSTPYVRRGPQGPEMGSPKDIQNATEAVSALVRETKQANPNSILMMYSNASSAMSDWRSNGCDLERIAKEGYLDVFVDQTWSGAWNEVGVRHSMFWNLPTLGWTYQLAYELMHGAILADTKVKRYPLVETFDAWESWDTLHTVPQRLRWGIWAYSHAAVKTPHGISMPQGSYISWANQGKRLLSPSDVTFLSINIGAAVRDAYKTKEVYGPTLVYSRDAMQWEVEHAKPDHNIKEWIDEQAGSVAKWPVPIMSATRVEWLDKIDTDLAVVQTPVHLAEPSMKAIEARIEAGKPVALIGSFSEGVDRRLLPGTMEYYKRPNFDHSAHSVRLPGAPPRVVGIAEIASVAHPSKTQDTGSLNVKNVPATFSVNEWLDQVTGIVSDPAQHNIRSVYGVSSYTVRGADASINSAQLLYSDQPAARVMLWNPPDFVARHDESLTTTWKGSAAPYVLAAATMNKLLQSSGALYADVIDMQQTGAVGAWRTSDGKLHMLFGNLEEGLRDDADLSRHFTMALPSAWAGKRWYPVWEQTPHTSVQKNMMKVDLPGFTSVLMETTAGAK